MKRTTIFRVGMILLAVVGLWSPRVQAAEPGAGVPTVFSQIDEDAQVVVVVSGLRNLSDKIHMLATKLQLAAQLPPDPLVILKMMSGFAQGIDDQGQLAVVLTGLNQAIENQVKPEVLILIPITNYQDFLENFAGGKTTDHQDIMQISLQGKPAFTKTLQGYALVGDKLATVHEYKAVDKAAQWAAKAGSIADPYLQQSEILVYVDVPPLAEALQVQLSKAMDEMADFVAGRPGVVEYLPLVEYLVTKTQQGLNALIADTQAVVLGLSIREAGLGIGGSVQFRQDSSLAKLFKTKPTGSLELNRLPDEPWISLNSTQWAHLDIEVIRSLALSLLPPDHLLPAGGVPTVTALRNLVQTQVYGDSSQQAQYVSADGTTRMVGVVLGKDSKKIFEQNRQVINLMESLLSQIPGILRAEADLPIALSYEEDALKVSDFSVDVLALTGQGEVAAAFTQQFGSPSLKMYLTHADDAVVYAMADEALLEKTIQASVAKKPHTGIATLEAIGKELPAHRMQESYLDLGNYLQHMQRTMMKSPNGMQMAMMMGMFQLPPGTPPVAMSVSNRQGGIGYHTHFPMDLLIALKNAGMAIMGPMMGGGAAH